MGTKYHLQHTHLNPAFGHKRDEPVFIVVEGDKDKCQHCREKEAADAAKIEKCRKRIRKLAGD